MHNSVRSFIREVRKETKSKYGFRSYFRFKSVLEVGSHNINGSPRDFFRFCKYTGIDISKGEGVDIIANFNDVFVATENQYDVVISTEMLEHDNQWDMSLDNMYRVLKPGGLLLITCAGDDRPEHGTKRTSPEDSPDTTDYYRNLSEKDFRDVLSPDMFDLYVLQYARGKNDLQFYGIKKYNESHLFLGNSYDPK